MRKEFTGNEVKELDYVKIFDTKGFREQLLRIYNSIYDGSSEKPSELITNLKGTNEWRRDIEIIREGTNEDLMNRIVYTNCLLIFKERNKKDVLNQLKKHIKNTQKIPKKLMENHLKMWTWNKLKKLIIVYETKKE